MNPRTNELYDLSKYSEEERIKLIESEDLVEVPPENTRAAKRALAGRAKVKISPTSGGKLSNWAKQIRRNMGIELDD